MEKQFSWEEYERVKMSMEVQYVKVKSTQVMSKLFSKSGTETTNF